MKKDNFICIGHREHSIVNRRRSKKCVYCKRYEKLAQTRIQKQVEKKRLNEIKEKTQQLLINLRCFKDGRDPRIPFGEIGNSTYLQSDLLRFRLQRIDDRIHWWGHFFSGEFKRLNQTSIAEFSQFWKYNISRIEKKCGSWDNLKYMQTLIRTCPICRVDSYFTEDFCSRCIAKISIHTPGKIARRCREKYPFELKGVQEVELLSAQINTANQIMEEAEL